MTWWQSILAWWRRHPHPQPVPTPTPTPAPAPPLPPGADDLILAINDARAANGRAWLIEVPALSEIAQADAGRMAMSGVLSHGDDLQRIAAAFPNVAAGEDIAEGYGTATGVVEAWLNDPPHRAILLDPKYSRLGVGVAQGNSNIFYVADFIQ